MERLKKHPYSIGIPLTVFGFVYQVIGAWVDWDVKAYPRSWQVAIYNSGLFVVWALFLISLFALGLGCFLLYVESVKYHKEHPGENVV